MKLKIQPGKARGTVVAPPSKSMAHRLLICGALSQKSEISSVLLNDDIRATLRGLSALGAEITQNKTTVTIGGLAGKDPVTFDCHESGSTLRFLLPLCLLRSQPVTLTGSPRLMERPLGVYEDICKKQGLVFEKSNGGITVCGPLKSGYFAVPGNISSQFISGLLFALPLLDGHSTIEIVGKAESMSYIDLTLKALSDFGITIHRPASHRFEIDGGQVYQNRTARVEGDWSGAAFWYALNALGGQIEIGGLDAQSGQGDKICTAYLDDMKQTMDLTDCPDLAPVLFAVAAAKGYGSFTGTARLKIKESDRAGVMKEELEKFGAHVEVGTDSVTVECEHLHPPVSVLSGHNDHRIVMALAVLCTLTGGEIDGCEAVSKSYPDFFEKLQSLEIQVNP